MDFTFTEEHEMIRQAARDYAERELIKDVLERDAKGDNAPRTCEEPHRTWIFRDDG